MTRTEGTCPLCGFGFKVRSDGKGWTRICPGCGEKVAALAVLGQLHSFDIDLEAFNAPTSEPQEVPTQAEVDAVLDAHLHDCESKVRDWVRRLTEERR